MANIIERDTEIIQAGERPTHPMATIPVMSGPPVEQRPIGAQPVAVHRDEIAIKQKLRTLAAGAGDDWFYRFPVRKKVRNEETGRTEYVTDHIEGPSIQCAITVARLFGNCHVDTRAFDFGTYYMFYGQFTDLETGFALTRPFQQRKHQETIRTKDPDRVADIVFQIGVSKCARNVVCKALEEFTDFAAAEAKKSIIDTVGKKLGYYKDKIVQRLSEMRIDLKAVEAVRGRPIKDWLAADVSMTIAELQAIQDGMATAGETYLGDLPDSDSGEAPAIEQSATMATVDAALDDFAAKGVQAATEARSAAVQAEAAKAQVAPAAAQAATTAAQAAPAAEDPVAKAQRLGREARAAGVTRRAVPAELRMPERKAEADGWFRGYDEAPP